MTRVFQIDYDLRAPGRNYDALINALKEFNGWCRPLKSTWVVTSPLTASQIVNSLRQHIDVNDGLLVTRLQGEAAWYGLSPEVSNWLQGELAA